MLEHVDRVQLAVKDRAAAVETYAAVFGAQRVREDGIRALNAHRTVVHAGRSEFEFLEPAGDGPLREYMDKWGEGLFAAGFSTADVDALARRLDAKGVRYEQEGAGNGAGQLFIAPDQTPGLRMVISKDEERPMVGLLRYLYEATNLIDDHAGAAAFYADTFGLDASRFSPITSGEFGYTGQLTLFNPPERLDRIELSQITQPEKAMGRFKTKRGESLYMCYAEAEETPPIVERLEKRGMRFAGNVLRRPNDSVFLHPATFHGMLMGISKTDVAWTWSGRPELSPAGARAH
jgi:catechol 2,3-dioxygenase-like lactoylglutathione lyase family enzyme